MISLYVNALLCTLQHIAIHAMQLSGVNVKWKWDIRTAVSYKNIPVESGKLIQPQRPLNFRPAVESTLAFYLSGTGISSRWYRVEVYNPGRLVAVVTKFSKVPLNISWSWAWYFPHVTFLPPRILSSFKDFGKVFCTLGAESRNFISWPCTSKLLVILVTTNCSPDRSCPLYFIVSPCILIHWILHTN